MDYIEVFNQLERKLSDKIALLQKQQEHLLAQKKHLLETKQKIQGFLSDACELKQSLDFNSELVQSVQTELNKIFKPEGKVNILTDKSNNNSTKSKPTNGKSTISKQPNLESNLDTSKNLELEPQAVMETEEQEPIRIFNFVDSEGKSTSF